MEPRMESCLAQVLQKDVGKRLQVGQELIDYFSDKQKSADLEHDQTMLDKLVDGLATSWVNSSNYKVVLLGMDILSALVTRLQDRFKAQIGTVLPSLIDRLGDAKDSVREQDQTLLLKIMDQAANPQYVWDRMLGGFKHKNFRTREGTCLCLVATLNASGAHTLTLSKIVPHICNLLGDPNSQVRDAAINSLVEIYRHVGERVRADLSKKGLPQSRLNVIFTKFDEVQKSGNMIQSANDKNFDDEDSVDGNRPSSASSTSSKAPPSSRRNVGMGTTRRLGSSSLGSKSSAAKEGAGAVDEEDFIKAFDDVPVVQIYSSRDLEESINKIREILSDDKHDWEQRVNALKKIRSLLLAGAAEYDNFFQHLRLLDGAFKLSAKDLRSQVVREACITLGHLSSVLGNKFDHGAEAIMPTIFNLIPNSAKIMATSGVVAVRLIIRHTHIPRLIPVITSNCTSKSVAVRRRCFEFLDLLLQEWQTHSLERHISVLAETIKKGIHDADSEARIEARKCYWGFHSHFSREAEHLYHTLESSYQKALQSHLKNSDSIVSLPQSDRSSSSSQESLNRPLSAKRSPTGSTTSRASTVSTKSVSTTGSLQRSRSDIDVNAAASAKSKVSSASGATPFSSAAALPPGSYASLESRHMREDMESVGHDSGRIRTRRQSSGSATSVATTPDNRGRSRAKVVSQSQRSRSANPAGAGSRSSSPGKLLGSSYGGLAGGSSRGPPVTPSSEKRSKIPRSQGCSRETSPNRIGLDRFGLGQAGRIPGSVNAMRVLSTSTDLEAAVADALKKPVRRRYEPYGMYSDDDANSDASSVCSERSYGSRNGGIPHYLRQTEDVAEVLNHCASSNWSERKEGLLGLQNLLKSQRTLSRVELKRLCEIFTRMFADPHSKIADSEPEYEDKEGNLFPSEGSCTVSLERVFSMFLETLVDFIIIHKDDLQDWLFVLLTQLLKKMGADLLGSVQAKVQKALDVTRDSFPFDQQFNILMRFIVDQTQTPNLKVKVAILKYIESLARQMDPTDFVNSSETRLAVSRIITWTTEPKSSDVRKAAQIVLISLFELNTPEFTMLLGALPKTFQDGATKLLHNHLKNSSNTSVGSPSNTIGRTPSRHTSSRTSPLTSPTNCSHGGLSPSMLEYDTENLNSEEIYSSLRGVTEAIEKFSFRSQEDLNEPIKRDGKKDCDIGSRDGGVASPATEGRGGSDVVEGGRTALDNKTSLLNTQPPRAFPGPRARDYNPYPYSDTINAYDKTALKEAVFDDDMEQLRDVPIDHSDLVADLLKELSNHNERVEERKGALLELLKITREDSLGVWEEHFKTILLLLLETLGDKDHSIRALALRVLREILRNQPARFKNYAELTIMKTLEAHKDSHKEVVRAAEEAASTLASSIHPEQCIKVLCPIIQTADYPINLAAIKMQTKVVERIAKESLLQLLADIIPGLLQGYDNTESSVRKASVFCLVAIYSVIGEELKPHLAQLTGSKMKLLNLYIKRAQTTNSNSSSSSDVSTHS
ncbi:CLIP-associating protein 1 isoform X3 [Panthera tigris]|uniref:CLIP-associating protein 1 isoform X3 n=1 Tax=Panthera leo TaxID=9689 RepID=UPI001C694B0B|nr:CLIP-associating protein 1 isoform X3 [Panthera leo]XP_042850153.1 CLIP-associating protein 1 isoform X3 [Panthera tigris]